MFSKLLSGACIAMAMLTNAQAVEMIAHRGASHDAPENTMAAVNLAWQLDADAVEIDIHMTRDGRIVLMHDGSTERTAGKDAPVREQDYKDLLTLDVGSWKDVKFAGEKIPTLEEALATIPEGKRMFVEIKVGKEIIPELARVVRASGKKPAQIALICFNQDTLAEAKKALPEHEAYWLAFMRRDKETNEWNWTPERLLEVARNAGVDGLDLYANAEFLTEAFVRQIREAGFGFYVWTVDSPETASKMVELGVDGITTNRPAWLTAQLKDANQTKVASNE